MLETFLPLIIDTGGPPDFYINSPDNIVPDAARGVVYTFYDSYVFAGDPIWTHDLETGAFVSAGSITFPISGNDVYQSTTACVVGGALFVVSYLGASGKSSLTLSKIDQATMTETASVALAAAGYVVPLIDLKTAAFTLGGTNYVAVALSATDPANIEVINVDTMTSVDSFDYPDAGGDCWLVAGHQPTGTTQKLYILADGFPAGDLPPFISLTFSSATGLSGATLTSLVAADIDAAWLGAPSSTPIDVSALMFDASDNHAIFAAWNTNWAAQGGTPGYIVKLNTTTGGIVWTVPIPDLPNAFDQSARLNDLSAGTLVFVPSDDVAWPGAPYGAIPAGSGVYYTITTADGSYETAFSTHFDNFPEHAQVWDSVNQKLIFYSAGPAADQTAGWFEGWAMLASTVVEEEAETGCQTSGFDLRFPPCVTTWTQCVKITRRDDVTFRFTSLDRDHEFRGETYVTCGGLDPSATQTLAQVGEVGSSELGGLITTTGVEEEELYGGLFDDAFVEIWLVDYEGSERPRRLAAGWAGKITHSTRGYRMEVLGPGARLEQRPIVQVYSPQCRWVFGDERCGVDIEALKVSGTVTSGLNRGVYTATLGASAESGTGAVASSGDLPGQFANGKVIWLTGVNAGQTTEVKEVDFDTGLITLWALTCRIPEAGDTFDLYPGCAQDFPTCRDVYDNGDAFGGFPHVPGRDAIMASPAAKAAP